MTPTSSSSARGAERGARSPKAVLVVDRVEDWPDPAPGVMVVTARTYLRDEDWQGRPGLRVFNLCRSWRYQSAGYYVSLLAVSRRHVPMPSLDTVLRMRSRPLLRDLDEELDRLIQRSLSHVRSERYELSIYFGRNLAASQSRLARRLFNEFPAPMMRARFRLDDGHWHLASIVAIPAREVPPNHQDFLHEAAREYFARPSYRRRSRSLPDTLGIVVDGNEELAPSNERALRRMERAFREQGFEVERIGKDDLSRVAELDAVFLRETTAVNHHTYRFAHRAEQLGIPVIDDPESILRCTNKVFLAETMQLGRIPHPRTLVVDRNDLDRVPDELGLPCVLKYPDSSFSRGVKLCRTAEEFETHAQAILAESDLLLAQEFLPTEWDWRVGVLDGRVLYACRYHMARGHWQIVRADGKGSYSYGKVEPVPLDDVPHAVLRNAVRAANRIGRGLYGVDLKYVGRRALVVEVNDNPNLDAGCEDAILGEELYAAIARSFRRRVDARRRR